MQETRLVGRDEACTRRSPDRSLSGLLDGGPSQAILKQAPGAEIVDFLCAQGFRAARTEGAKS